jgi:hypothetical protein
VDYVARSLSLAPLVCVCVFCVGCFFGQTHVAPLTVTITILYGIHMEYTRDYKVLTMLIVIYPNSAFSTHMSHADVKNNEL